MPSRRCCCAIIFSKDRPMQLFATLESMKKNVSGIHESFVIIKYSSHKFKSCYQKVKKIFPNVNFYTELNFKQDVLNIVNNPFYTHILFSVDDTVFQHKVHLPTIFKEMDQEVKSIGFSLRLGYNTNYCYMLNRKQKLKTDIKSNNNIIKWKWPHEQFDYSYPLELSSSVYRASFIRQLVNKLDFKNPNTLEMLMDRKKGSFATSHPYLLSFERSACFSNPVNLTQNIFNNRNANKHSINQLLFKFEQGLKIDLTSQYITSVNSCHFEIPLLFKNR
jgi:hypothetical protein